MNDQNVDSILRDIRRYFGFLFERGYRISCAELSGQVLGNWNVALASSTSVIYISNDRGRITLELSPVSQTDPSQRIPIERLILTMTADRDLVIPFKHSMSSGKRNRLKRLSSLLQEHMDEITAHFAVST